LRKGAHRHQDENSCKESFQEESLTKNVHPKPPISHTRA
jgi:hypothetical protein